MTQAEMLAVDFMVGKIAHFTAEQRQWLAIRLRMISDEPPPVRKKVILTLVGKVNAPRNV